LHADREAQAPRQQYWSVPNRAHADSQPTTAPAAFTRSTRGAIHRRGAAGRHAALPVDPVGGGAVRDVDEHRQVRACEYADFDVDITPVGWREYREHRAAEDQTFTAA
jgi:hypothetical protein